MRRKIASGIMLTLLSVCMLMLTCNVPSHALSYYRVHNIDTGLDYATIQEAINAPETLDGHTIKADPGTYHEHIFVNKSVQIIGVYREFNFLDGNREAGTVVTITADDVMVGGFTIMNSGNQPTDAGIRVESSCGTIIVSNSLVNTSIGILVVNSENNTLDCNRMENCEYGDIELRNSDNNLVVGNSMGNHGIRLWECNSNILRRNWVSGAEYGITLRGNHNNITGNTFENNVIGINLQGNQSTVVKNIIRSNIQCGIKISGGDNAIYHNNFLDNANQACVDSANSWDDGYPSGGNHWSDHSSVDWYSGSSQDIMDSDGISDEPYVIDTSNRDRYPLMKWPPPLIVVSFSPPINKVEPDETFTIDIKLANVPPNEANPHGNGLYGWSINLTFNPDVLNVEKVTEGPFLKEVDNTILLPSNIDNTIGFVIAGCMFMPPLPENGANGSGVLATVDFTVKGKGVSNLMFKSVKLFTVLHNNNIPMEPPNYIVFEANGIVSVSEPPIVPVAVDVAPNMFNLQSDGVFLVTYLELPEGYNVNDIDISTIMLNDTIAVFLPDVPAQKPVPTEIGDYDSDGVCDLMVKFNRTKVSELILHKGITYGNVTLTITGTLLDGTQFEGSDSIRVIFPSTWHKGYKRQRENNHTSQRLSYRMRLRNFFGYLKC